MSKLEFQKTDHYLGGMHFTSYKPINMKREGRKALLLLVLFIIGLIILT